MRKFSATLVLMVATPLFVGVQYASQDRLLYANSSVAVYGTENVYENVDVSEVISLIEREDRSHLIPVRMWLNKDHPFVSDLREQATHKVITRDDIRYHFVPDRKRLLKQTPEGNHVFSTRGITHPRELRAL